MYVTSKEDRRHNFLILLKLACLHDDGVLYGTVLLHRRNFCDMSQPQKVVSENPTKYRIETPIFCD
jgi:hypothetical protein